MNKERSIMNMANKRGLIVSCIFSVFLLTVFYCNSFVFADSTTVDNSNEQEISQTGSWSVSHGDDPFDPDDPSANSLWARGGDDTFSWHFKAPQSGKYEVSEWHSGYDSRTNAAPVVITHADGSANVSVNQQTTPGQWNRLGVYPFEAGQEYRVTVTSVADRSSTCADAIKWTLVPDGDNQPPVSNEFFPDKDKQWETMEPDDQGVDPDVLQDAIDYFDANSGGVGVDEMVIVRNGYIISQGTNTENQHEIFSGSKTFTTAVLGLLLQDKLIGSVDDKVVDNKYQVLDADTYSEYKNITFEHLATMTSGYDSVKGGCWQAFTQGAYNEHNACVREYIKPGKRKSIPGAVFDYYDPPVHLLGYVMTQIARESLEDIYKERIADKIGMKVFKWTDYGEVDGIIFDNPAGTPGIDPEKNPPGIAQGGVITTAQDVARVGLLYLNGGNWNGEPILDEEWVTQSTTNRVSKELPGGDDHKGRFGYMWHTNDLSKNGERRWPSAPPKTYTFFGHSRNYCFVIPEWNMVIVRMSPYEDEHDGMKNPSKVWDRFFSKLKNGVTDVQTISN